MANQSKYFPAAPLRNPNISLSLLEYICARLDPLLCSTCTSVLNMVSIHSWKSVHRLLCQQCEQRVGISTTDALLVGFLFVPLSKNPAELFGFLDYLDISRYTQSDMLQRYKHLVKLYSLHSISNSSNRRSSNPQNPSIHSINIYMGIVKFDVLLQQTSFF